MSGVRLRLALLLALAAGLGWAAPARAGDRDQVFALVQEGRQLFEDGKFVEAQEKFQSAELLEPENALIAYNRARTYHAAGDLDQARSFYAKARTTTNLDLNARVAFNLADLDVQTARGKLGDKPEAVAGEARKEVLEHLYSAVARYRTVLEVKPDDPDARYNIELIRHVVKNLEDRWRKADRDKARQEADLTGFLDYMRKVQRALVRQSDQLQREDAAASRDRPVILEQVQIVQEELQAEIPHLKTKVREFFDKAGQAVLNPPGGPGPNTPDPRQLESLKEAEKELMKRVDSADQAMGRALDALGEVQLAEARAAQKNAHDTLDTMWRSVAAFGTVLGRAVEEQNALVAVTEPWIGSDDEPDTGARDPARVEEEKFTARILGEDQELVRGLIPVLEKRAEQALEQLKSMPAKASPSGGQTPAGQPDPEELRKAFQKTLELLPDADRAMQAATLALGNRTWDEALAAEKEAARILEEIRKLFPQQENQQQKSKDPKQDSQQENEQDQQKQKDPKGQKSESDSRKLDREEAERLMRQMREKRNKREQGRRGAQGGSRIRVEKDW